MGTQNKIKVFISYSHDSAEHKEFVRELADKLKLDGIDCLIDQDIDFPQGPPQGWTKWMMEKIEWAGFVLVMFTPQYAKSWCGDGNRRGSMYEGTIITQQIYNNFCRNVKFIPVIREKGDPNDVQFPLNDFTVYTLMKDYDSLHSGLTGQFSQKESEKQAENNDDSNDCPYCGLQAFTEDDAENFFGRDNFIHNQLLPAIEKNSLPFISLFGASGVGKSSVVFAGLIPRLKRKNWTCVDFEPGNDPFDSLAQTLITLNDQIKDASVLAKALKEGQYLSDYLVSIEKKLSHDNYNLLIIIDKFEEIYRDKPNESNNNLRPDQVNQGFKFLRSLLGGIKWLKEKSYPNRIVFLAITTSEGHSKTTDFPDYAELSSPSAHIQLTGLKPEEMRQVIEKPAKKKGVEFEKGLVDDILSDAGQKSGMLPLLEVALRRSWFAKTDKLITKDAYNAVGGINALINYADECVGGLSDDEKKIASEIFIRIIDAREDLVNPEDISPRAILEENLTVEKKVKSVIDFLVKMRLLVRKSQGANQFLEIPHKELIHSWPQINVWLNQDARIRFFINDLRKRSGKWQENGRKINDLDSGLMLELTEEFLKKNENDFRLTDLMKEFHKKGVDNKEKNKRNKRRNYALIALVGIIVFILVSMVFVGKQTAETMHRDTQEQLARAIKGKYLSSGEKTHFAPPNSEKWRGNEHFKINKYKEAELAFEKSRKDSLDDPEALIYSNNAKAFRSKNYLTIVASVPIKYSNDIAKEMLRGIAQAQHEINSKVKGGIQGKLLHVAIADDNNDPADVEVIANYLINDYSIGDSNGKEVLAVIGSNVTEATKQAANIYQGKIVMISPTSFAVKINEIKKPENGKNYIFLAVNDSEVFMPRLVQHIKEAITHPKLLVCDDYKADDQRALRDHLDRKISLIKVKNNNNEDYCDLNNTASSYTRIVDKAIQLGINSLFIAPHVSRINEGINLAKYARTKKPDLKLYGSPTFYNATTLMNGEITTDLVIPAHWHPEISQKHSFYKEAKKLWGEQNINGITWRTAASYDSVFIIITALEKTNGEFNRKTLQQQLTKKDFRYDGALGEIRFEQNGTRKNSNSYLVEVKPCLENCSEEYKYSFYLTN